MVVTRYQKDWTTGKNRVFSHLEKVSLLVASDWMEMMEDRGTIEDTNV
jgi:hypothetical protein